MDDFSDDGFDDLNDIVLQELENNAIQFTQAQKFAQSQAAPQPPAQRANYDYSYGFEDDDLDDTVVIDELAQLPVRHPADKQPTPTPPSRPVPATTISGQQRWNQPGQLNTSFSAHPRYTTPPITAQPQPNRPPAYPSQRPPPRPIPAPSRHVQPPPGGSQYMRPPPPPLTHRAGFEPSQVSPVQSRPGTVPQNQNDLVAALQARLHALEAELTSTKGEVAIVRSKYDKSVTTHEAEVARLKKQNAESLSKQERLVEQALAAERSAATELQFTKQDLKAELEKAKKGRKDGAGAVVTTPKKARSAANWGNVADGFDDVEILPSPSKGQGGRSKSAAAGAVAPPMAERTPTKGKRKRPMIDSPVMALEVHEEEDAIMADSAHEEQRSGLAEVAELRQSPSLPFDFLKLVLDHSGFHGQPLTFDLLARYAFPSDSAQSIASLVFQKLPFLGNPEDPMRLLVDFCNLLLDLWSQCLKEKYHAPIYDLISLVSFILQLNTVAIAPHIISTLVPVAQTTVFLVAIPRFQSPNPDGDLSSNDPDGTLQRLCQEIDTEGALQLMYLTALGCMTPSTEDMSQPELDSPQTTFWKLTQPDFVLGLLSPKQAPDDFLGMLSLVCTSSLPGSIGPITSDADKSPAVVAQVIIDRVSLFMKEPPKWAVGSPTDQKVAALSNGFNYRQCVVRLATMRALMAFAQSPFGAQQLALSDVALPRLVAVLCGAIDALYDMDIPKDLFSVDAVNSSVDLVDSAVLGGGKEPEETAAEGGLTEDPNQTQEDPSNDSNTDVPATSTERVLPRSPALRPAVSEQPDPTPLIHIIITSATLLLHALVTDPSTSSLANMPHRLASSHGGSQRYLLTLARLNFAEEDLVLEAGIDADTVERAHELLELAVTPDEGDGVGEVFGF
ncbi:DNA repair protein Rad26 [Pleurostoma richardsiae]|uniref:DNA repair protein Rad26 n=1 Tax=Pleurostoma richardsiae TaxID=41990 RepID=A0AA38R6L8_9PEZI|nr:DNA repair protein Rad26 [Pleurostoma richardsiae]